jgi:hypothetical protein
MPDKRPYCLLPDQPTTAPNQVESVLTETNNKHSAVCLEESLELPKHLIQMNSESGRTER